MLTEKDMNGDMFEGLVLTSPITFVYDHVSCGGKCYFECLVDIV